jgi:methyl-accepting chemotaxis protein
MHSLLDRIPVSARLRLVSLAYTLLFAAVVGWLLVKGINPNIDFGLQEKRGNAFQRPLERLLEKVPEHGLAVRRAQDGAAGAKERVPALRREIDEAFAALAAAEKEYGEALRFSADELAKRKREGASTAPLLAKWEALKGRSDGTGAEAAAEAHREIVAGIRTMITHAGDTSNLILDPDLDSYYLMEATLVALPQTQERIASIVLEGTGMLRGGAKPDMAGRMRMASHAALLKEADIDRVAGDAQTSLNEDPNFYGTSESLQRKLPPAVKDYVEASEAFRALVARIATEDAPGVTPEALEGAGARAREASFALWRTAADELDLLLDHRVGAYRNDRTKGLILTAVVSLLAWLLVHLVGRSITGSLGTIGGLLEAAASELGSSAEALAESSAVQADGCSRQAAAVEETSAATEEISAMARQNRESAGGARQLSEQAGEYVGKAAASMETMVGKMHEISAIGGQIGSIIKTIDEIAFQTNLLALNAAVEAARAGEAGAGFAVVADEVRNLAQRAAAAARSTGELIEGSIARIGEGVTLVGATHDDFRSVADCVRKTVGLIGEIAAATDEQVSGMSEMGKGLQAIDRDVQGGAASAEEIASAASQLAAHSRTMHDAVLDLQALAGTRREGAGEAAPQAVSLRTASTTIASSGNISASRFLA